MDKDRIAGSAKKVKGSINLAISKVPSTEAVDGSILLSSES
jgi:hypothetical protein